MVCKFFCSYKKSILIYSLVFAFALLFLCLKENNNEKIYTILKNEFKDSIQLNNYQYFKYQYDGLTPQKTFFHNGKIKCLWFRTNPELGFIEYILFYSKKNNYLEKCVIREVLPNWEKHKKGKPTNFTDEISVFDLNKKIVRIYTNNELSLQYKFTEVIQNNNFIARMKIQTELDYKKQTQNNLEPQSSHTR